MPIEDFLNDPDPPIGAERLGQLMAARAFWYPQTIVPSGIQVPTYENAGMYGAQPEMGNADPEYNPQAFEAPYWVPVEEIVAEGEIFMEADLQVAYEAAKNELRSNKAARAAVYGDAHTLVDFIDSSTDKAWLLKLSTHMEEPMADAWGYQYVQDRIDELDGKVLPKVVRATVTAGERVLFMSPPTGVIGTQPFLVPIGALEQAEEAFEQGFRPLHYH